jgi:hypothetical protein
VKVCRGVERVLEDAVRGAAGGGRESGRAQLPGGMDSLLGNPAAGAGQQRDPGQAAPAHDAVRTR